MNKKKRFLSSFRVWLLMIAILLQSCALALTGAAAEIDLSELFKKQPEVEDSKKPFEKDEIISQLKKELLNSINRDLIRKVEEDRLTGPVDVILAFSEDSLIGAYAKDTAGMTYPEYRDTLRAADLKKRLNANQNSVLKDLESGGLITDVKYHYYHMFDGAYVSTTYEQLDAICKTEGVERVLIANTYRPADAVENKVNTYETGIFNSSDVSYTGKGTIVAILDTGCDYTHTAFTTHEVADPLYDRDDIEALLDQTVAYELSEGSLEAREVYYGNITGNKIAFGYDYADQDPDVMPFSSEHGTHVAGIIGGKDSTITGVAVDTQLAIMKVFSDYREGAKDGDILAGLEDAIVLGVDAINMSLGTSCGFSREVDDIYKDQLYDRIEEAGISLVVAASNDYSSAYGGAEGNTNKTGNPDSATVGSPSTSSAALSVASISGVKDKYMLANGNREVFFHESANMAAKDYDFFAMLGVTEGNPKSYEYVTIPGFGLAINYAGMDMKGKIALVRRGDITFEEKVQFAHEAGAAGVIIYNNVFGEIVMTVGNDLKIPAISIGKDDGEAMAAQESGTLFFDVNNQAGPFMSDFSSWGPTPDLKLKPEITAHGGNILSSVPGGGYEKLSGTSMAAPNMCGITVLIRQYVKEKYPTLTPAEVRDMVNRLCMSTATLALDRKGNPYSPRKQGAGIADILRATTTPAYLWVEGLGTTKLELGDDPQRTGEYKMSIKLSNLSDAALSYRLGNITMTESVSTSDPEYVAEMAYLLNNSAEYSAENATLVDGVLTVQPNQTAVVTVTLKLSAADKSYLNSNFKNGMYVEGFLTFDNTADDGIDLNAPFLAFYGDWAEAPIFDKDYYEVETEAHNNAIDDDDKIKADYYATTPMGKYYYDYAIPLGSYVYTMNEEEYTPIPATAEHAAMSYYANSINGIYAVYTGLLRGAKEMSIRIVNTATGEVVWEKTEHNCYKSHFSGAARPYFSSLDLNMANYETGEVFGDNNAHYEVIMSAQLDWKKDSNRNSSDTYSFSFYIDYEAPTITDAEFRTEYDKSKKENRYYVDLTVYDNHYAMSVRPIIMYEYEKDDGTMGKTYTSLGEYPIPVYQQTRGSSSKVTVEITDYIDLIKESGMREGITFYVDDYALNGNICYVPFPETESSDLAFENRKMDMKINETVDLTESLVHTNGSEDEVVRDYLKTLTWTTSDPAVVAVHDGQIEALQSGVATISVTGDTWVSRTGRKIIRTIDVTVGSESVENPDSRLTTQIEKLAFTYYDTLFAFNGDIDRSEIGETGSMNYFDGNYNISFYPSEKVQLHYDLRPWNMDPSRYELSWSSSNPKVATVDENGVVTAEEKGRCSITLRITIDGKPSILAARCSIEVKSEFIIENRQLVAYKGKGGDVVIPDDEGIMTIGSFAFCHYKLDNEKDVPKDEDGTYDFDLKKEPLGNNSVTSVVIPDGVETIEKYAFYNCKLLKKVVLPESCKTIGAYAFWSNKVLEDVDFNRVKVINDYAFYECEKLTNVDLSRVNSIGVNAFAGCSGLTEISLNDLRRTGAGAFKNCTNLKTVVLGERGRLAENAFENTAIENIVIFSDTIPDGAFKDCKALKTVEIKNDLTYLGMEAFSGCTALESVVFRGGCEQIANSAFVNCTALKNFTLPNCDVVLGDGAFENSGLTSLTFGKKTVLTEIGNGVFWGVNGLNVNVDFSDHYTLTDGVVYSKDGSQLVLATLDADLGNFIVPASVKEICSGAFSFNQSLISVTFMSGFQLERIGYGAFSCCGALERVELPVSEISIGAFAFYQTLSLKDFDFTCVTSVGDFAFSSSAITSAKLTKENVEIGIGAFLGCSGLAEVTVSAGAKIGEYAFRQSGVTTVAMSGDGVTVNEGAFYYCTKLKSIDLTHVVGKLGDAAFYMCSSLTSVDMPNVTELGVGCFADCYQLSAVKADKLEVIGAKAFSAVDEDAQSGAVFTTVSFPSLKKIGAEAFLGCIYLEQIDLTGVTEIESGAFGVCASLKKVILSDSLTVLNDSVFYGCSSLEEIDLQYIVEFGSMVLFGAKLSSLNLLNAEKIGDGAFIEDPEQDAHFLTSVNAPKLTSVGSQAFAYCQNLKSFSAPMLEEIGMAAFAYTAFEEFEITPNLKTVEHSPFFGAENLKAFYMMVNGSKTYSGKYQNVMIDNGVLYTSVKNGYVLSVYPVAKTDAELTVADGTVRIEFRAAYGNENLEKVTLPESLRYIGDFAFSGCSKLKTVVFRSYYAPVLEGTLTGEVEITPDTIEDYPGFDSFYRYDYYYRAEDQVGTPRYYHNFVGLVTSKDAADLVCVLPDQCEGYDTTLYRAYFTPAEETSGETVGKYALAFIDAVRKLPEVADRFDKALVDAAVTAYNALEGHSEERKFVSDELLDLYKKACREYHVSVAENMIAHLFDMDNSEYFYNLVKDANLYFNGLTDEERALVSNTERLTQRTSELSAAMGKELNFELSYADYFKSPDNPPVIDPPNGDDDPEPPAPNNGMAPWVIVLIVTGSVLVLAAAAVAVMLILRKKKSAEMTEQK